MEGILRILVCPSHGPTVLSYDLETIWRKTVIDFSILPTGLKETDIIFATLKSVVYLDK